MVLTGKVNVKYPGLLYIERLKFKITFTLIAIEIPIKAIISNVNNIPLIKSGIQGVKVHIIKKIAKVNEELTAKIAKVEEEKTELAKVNEELTAKIAELEKKVK